MDEKLPSPCEACRGTGLRKGSPCSECGGKGYRLFINGNRTLFLALNGSRFTKLTIGAPGRSV
jgi:DnaJ-class molecular chaperone